MRIALLGYGKMGKVIEQIALDRGHEISFKIDVSNLTDREKISPENTDAVIEFSSPASAYENLKFCMSKGLKTVSGTTGWLEHRAEIESLCEANDATFFYASNYSVGVNLFFQLNKQLAKLMNGQPQYEITSSEIHHTEKLDSPSGTAITLAEGIMENNETKTSWVNQAIPKADEVPIWSLREGKVPGTHTIKYISDVDEIEIRHEAKSRQGFALGAVLAAEWVKNQKGVVGMDEMLGF
ncbi:4-hydroxy-tetrahydrodipicolinate reductase [Arcticibacterium luteifluviistationis]|uniref:4-hydroxy-tetrahydrodipicolinate reductase n=1 Tax=Arcticibacterium luteifluviistationis TaxID=1784714 RepID=A0A2Z4G816_9BACT|nr:4-hydroxy-tetrahydrodipicolinate reductase [Arcticibacterium luteifluviistationis]AWV97314.1 4-hydroxy-tetrahydrodipicolinate reductase [Arcticibacterium luteifluviistationis]